MDEIVICADAASLDARPHSHAAEKRRENGKDNDGNVDHPDIGWSRFVWRDRHFLSDVVAKE